MSKPYASAIEPHEHVKVFAQIIAERMNALQEQASVNRVYLISQVHADALYYLAEQFDVLGYKGWFLANTEEARRDLIRRAIELHRYMGTPWAVKESIRSLGFQDVTLIERVGLIANLYNGLFTYNGSEQYGGNEEGDWATFTVIIDLNSWTEYIGTPYITALLGMIDTYKNVRSHLVDLIFQLNFSDDLALEDATDLGNDLLDTDSLDFGLQYDGVALYDGGFGYDETGDSLIVEVIGPPEPSMIISIATSGATFPSEIYFAAAGSGTLTVDWGDGDSETVLIDDQNEFPHTYDGSVSNPQIELYDFDQVDQFYMSYPAISTDGSIMPFITSIVVNMPALYFLNIYGLPSLNSIEIQAMASGYNYVDVSGCALSIQSVDDLFISLHAAGMSSGFIFTLGQTPPAPPTAASLSARTALAAAGVTIQTD
jgi:P2-related tail formation protein